MEIISFDIVGKFAHFRRFYSNSTALSFTIPPRTSLIGIIAAFVGRGKNDYYVDFCSENILIGLDVRSNLKKSFHRLNLLSIKSPEDFRGANGRTQVPFEVITGENLRKDEVAYRIFVSHTEKGKKIFDTIKESFLNQEQKYNVSFGLANFSASIQNVKIWDDSKFEEMNVTGESIEFHSVTNTEDVSELLIAKEVYSFIEEDLFPADFRGNNDREVIKMNRLLFTIGNIPLKAKFTGTYYALKDEKGVQNIQFLKPVS